MGAGQERTQGILEPLCPTIAPGVAHVRGDIYRAQRTLAIVETVAAHMVNNLVRRRVHDEAVEIHQVVLSTAQSRPGIVATVRANHPPVAIGEGAFQVFAVNARLGLQYALTVAERDLGHVTADAVLVRLADLEHG